MPILLTVHIRIDVSSMPSPFPPSLNLVSCLSSVTPTANPSSTVMSSKLSLVFPNRGSYPNFALSPSSLNTATPKSETSTPMLFRYSHPSELDHLVVSKKQSLCYSYDLD